MEFGPLKEIIISFGRACVRIEISFAKAADVSSLVSSPLFTSDSLILFLLLSIEILNEPNLTFPLSASIKQTPRKSSPS